MAQYSSFSLPFSFAHPDPTFCATRELGPGEPANDEVARSRLARAEEEPPRRPDASTLRRPGGIPASRSRLPHGLALPQYCPAVSLDSWCLRGFALRPTPSAWTGRPTPPVGSPHRRRPPAKRLGQLFCSCGELILFMHSNYGFQVYWFRD